MAGLVVAAGVTLAHGAETATWKPASAPLMTRWAAEVSPTRVHPEYPRPQLVRADWLNLNGLWDYAIRPLSNSPPTSYEGQILVPFPIESALSGVRRQLDERSVLWYRRQVVIPQAWQGRQVRLQGGAVDWHCRLLVNGHEVGQHYGGFDRIAFDITKFLHGAGNEEIVVAVTDPTEGDQPRGKQTRTPEGIFYSANSGIWQTIWLEPVGSVCIDGLKLTPDVEAKALRLRVAVNSLTEDVRVEVVASASGAEAGRAAGLGNAELFLPIARPRLWSPQDPFLYDLTVTLKQGNKVIDQVFSYFGLRKVGLLPDEQGIVRIALNDQFPFELGVLDQGFWPEGIYTAPTDAALKSDLEFLKEAGFNLVRKHVKIEPDRWYYWCDKLGLLVWQDMPSANNATAEGRQEFETELLQMVRGLNNHPSIIMWVLFNEGWGQYDTERLTQWVKELDPSRLVNNASGWTDTRVGDIVDVHSYPGPDAPEPEARRASVLGEFGGLGLPVDKHSWSSNRWSYKNLPDTQAFQGAYARLLERVWTLHDRRGLSAAVYTQITDVETECNGLLTYDRAFAKLPAALAAAANSTAQRVPLTQVVVNNAQQGPVAWRYTFERPGTNWFLSNYDVSAWKTGASGFGTPITPGARVGTLWNTADIWLRREFVLRPEELRDLKLEVYHDEDAEIYLNGVEAARLTNYIANYEEFEIAPAAVAALRPGTNTLSVHCHQTAGGQYIDVGLVAKQPAKPKPPEKAEH